MSRQASPGRSLAEFSCATIGSHRPTRHAVLHPPRPCICASRDTYFDVLDPPPLPVYGTGRERTNPTIPYHTITYHILPYHRQELEREERIAKEKAEGGPDPRVVEMGVLQTQVAPRGGERRCCIPLGLGKTDHKLPRSVLDVHGVLSLSAIIRVGAERRPASFPLREAQRSPQRAFRFKSKDPSIHRSIDP